MATATPGTFQSFITCATNSSNPVKGSEASFSAGSATDAEDLLDALSDSATAVRWFRAGPATASRGLAGGSARIKIVKEKYEKSARNFRMSPPQIVGTVLVSISEPAKRTCRIRRGQG